MRRIKVASAQIPAFSLAQADQSLAVISEMIQSAGEQQVELLVLPECAYPAYLIESEDNYRQAGMLETDEFFIFLGRQARKARLHIVCGFVEDVHTHLNNSAVLIDAGGQTVGIYRKSFLWAADNDYFKPGDRVPVFETSIGRIGVVICADTRAPEIIAKEITDGAELIAMPTCWVNIAREPGAYENPQPEYLISARAREFNVPFVCANKFGMEGPKIGYCGRSLITDRDGNILAEASGDGQTLLVTDIEPRDTDRMHRHDELWQSLIHWTEPIRPSPRASGTINIGVWCGEVTHSAVFDWARDSQLALAVCHGLEAVDVPENLRGILVVPEHAGALIETLVGKVGCVNGTEITRFGRARLLALGGMELLCVFDGPDDLNLLRTRAIENRTFVLASNPMSGAMISPGGEILACASDCAGVGLCAEIDVTAAADKHVAPRTDIWEQRRVQAYI